MQVVTKDTNQRLVEDAASLSRVRNRFGASPDEKLHTIMPALVPKLFERLENYRTIIMGDNATHTLDAQAVSSLTTGQHHIYGILASATERLRGNTNISTDSLAGAMLPFIDSDNNVIATWASAFLQTSIQRTSVSNTALISTIIPVLLEFTSKIQKKILESEENNASQGPLGARWIGISWLLLDTLVLNSGNKPLADWNYDTFDKKFFIERKTSSDDTCSRSLLIQEAARIMTAKGPDVLEGLFSLTLDLILFWPGGSIATNQTISRFGIRRMQHKLTTNSDGLEPNWTDSCKSYLRCLKLVSFEFSISLPGYALLRDGNDHRALLLSILLFRNDCRAGRLATNFLNNWKRGDGSIPFPVATSILILIIGDERAREILDTYEKHLGNRFWEQLLCSTNEKKNEDLRRPPIRWEVSTTAANFLMENSLNLTESDDTSNAKPDSNNDKHIILLIELALKISEMDSHECIFLSMRLVSFFCEYLKEPDATLASKIFNVITRVLMLLANLGTEGESRTSLLRNDGAPLGVPAPFGNRNDLNQLLRNHRQDLKQKAMKGDHALKAREEAYKMIPRLSSNFFSRADASPFQLPNLLLQCAVDEDRRLVEYVIAALDLTLVEYKRKLDGDQSIFTKGDTKFGKTLQQQATSILPALLEAVCSGAEHARMSAAQWIQELLVNMDVEAASYLASHLIHDGNTNIARIAQNILDTIVKQLPSREVSSEPPCISFVDIINDNGFHDIQKELRERIKRLAMRLKLSHDESMILLLHNDFSVGKAEFEYNNKKCSDIHGLFSTRSIVGECNEDDGVLCGICYDEVDVSQTYSLHCGHKFCKYCWISYMTDASNEASGMDFLDLRCPHHECTTHVMLDDFRKLQPSLISIWNHKLLQRFVEMDPWYRYCPGADCGCVAIKTNHQSTVGVCISQKITCDFCDTTFCFDCGQNDHTPASCRDMTQWNTRVKGSSHFWIRHHSKPCPGCNIPIEKNTGCNHMHCTKCKTDFCWVCLSLLNEHLGPHICNVYDPADTAEDDFERRALFIATRYDAQDFAVNFARTQREHFDPEKFIETYWFVNEDEDPDIMARALEAVVDGRTFLKYSYVKMLFLTDQKPRVLHEDHHVCLEMFTERLSRLTEINLHSHYTLRGQREINLHFRRLSFFTVSVNKYIGRIVALH